LDLTGTLPGADAKQQIALKGSRRISGGESYSLGSTGAAPSPMIAKPAQ
jgi:hypothetical protein